MPQPNIAEYYHLGHSPSIVVLKDRDTFCFYSDFLQSNVTLDADDTITYYTEDTDTNSPVDWRYYTDPDTPIDIKHKFTLLCTRLTSNNIANGTSVVCYKLDANSQFIAPIHEAHQPKVTYDPTSNQLTLWFWTYFKTRDDNGDPVWQMSDGYDQTYVYSQYNTVSETWDVEIPEGVERYLCYAKGSLQKFVTIGGGVTVDQFDGIDLVPIFDKPRLIEPVTKWTDLRPYPSNENVYSYQRSDNSTLNLLEGQPLIPHRGTSPGVNTYGDLYLDSPIQTSDASIFPQVDDIYDGFPYFFVHSSYLNNPHPSTDPAKIPSDKYGYATYPSGAFMALVDPSFNSGWSITVGEPLGVLGAESECFVRGVFGARCIALIGEDIDFGYIKVLAVRDHVSPLVMATSDPADGVQTVQIISSSQDLSTPPTGQTFTVASAPNPLA